VSFAYLPGFFHANLREAPQVGYCVRCEPSQAILAALENNEQDLGIICPPKSLPQTLRITHRFDDAFTLIAPTAFQDQLQQISKKKLIDWLKVQRWLLIDDTSNTGRLLREWMRKENMAVDPTMQLDNFDLIINLVSLGMGMSFVPVRALAVYNARHKVIRIPTLRRFNRELVVVVRKNRKLPAHVEKFISNVLF
jgi:DNA-binding transcriptional LysR family regulator